MRRLAWRLWLAVGILMCTACNHHQTGKRYFVAFSQCNNAEPYRTAQNQLMQRLFDQKGDVQLVIADAQQDNSKQIAQIETFIREKPDLLIVAPNERAPLTDVMGRALAAGIRVICLERDITQPNYTTFIREKPDLLIVAPNERAPLTDVMGRALAAGIRVICLERDITQPNYTTFIGADNVAIGNMAGEFIVDALTRKNGRPQGKVVEIRGLLGVEAEMERYNGAHEITKAYPGIRFVHEAVADWLQSNARERMSEILRAEPSIDVVYAHNDPMAIGAYLAARDLGRDKQMTFIGIDGLGGPAGGIKKVMDGVLAVTFYYPLCVDKAVEIGEHMLRDSAFRPDKQYILQPEKITAANASQMYDKLTF
jgi:ribose transport system substrate-binding protein